jgi:E3 ubiquitin-protein ligase RNF14
VTSEVVSEYVSLDEKDPRRLMLERQYGKKFLLKLVAKHEEDKENDRWFKASTTPCPGCSIRVEKNHGCNHVCF